MTWAKRKIDFLIDFFEKLNRCVLEYELYLPAWLKSQCELFTKNAKI